MKMKKILSALVAFILIASVCISFAGCGKKVEVQAKVGVLLFENNSVFSELISGYEDSLNSRYEEGAIVYIEKDAQKDASKFAGLIQELVDEGVDAIAACGDEAAQAAVSQNLTVPVFFLGVSDALALKLTTKLDAPDKNATGSELAVPADRLIEQSRKLVEAPSYGIIYDSSNMTGAHSATLLEIAISNAGLPFDAKGVTSKEEAEAAAEELLKSQGALILTTDAVVSEAAQSIIASADAKKIPVFGFSQDVVEMGAALGVSASIRELGGMVGQQTYHALNGKAIGTMPVINTVSGIETYVNMGKSVALGYTLSDEILNTTMLLNKVDLEETEEVAADDSEEE